MKKIAPFFLVFFLSLCLWLYFSSSHFNTPKEEPSNELGLQNSSATSALFSPGFQDYIDRLQGAHSIEEYLKIIRSGLMESEAGMLQVLAAIDHPFMDHHVGDISGLLFEYFSAKYSALDALERIQLLSERGDNVYHLTAVELLSYAREFNDSPQAIIAFLNGKDHEAILDEVDHTLGMHLKVISEGGAVEALALVAEMTDQERAVKALHGIYHQWILDDLEAAQAHLAKQPSHPNYDIPARELLGHINNADYSPEAQMAWADSITDASIRNSASVEVAESWIAETSFDDANYLAWKSKQSDPDLLAKIEVMEENAFQHQLMIERNRPVTDLIAQAHEAPDYDSRRKFADEAATKAIHQMESARLSGDNESIQIALNAYEQIFNSLRGSFRDSPLIKQIVDELSEQSQ